MQANVHAMIRLFNAVSETVGDGLSPQRMTDYERRIHAIVCDEKPVKFALLKPAIVVGISVAVVALLLSMFLFTGARPIPFTLAGHRALGVVGVWLTTGAGEASQLNFDMGNTHFLINPESKVQVSRSDETAVELVLENGSLLAEVQGNGATRWSVSAGPYMVTVMGTKFLTTWNERDKVFDVRVDKGTVLVEGIGISANGVQVTTDQHFRAVQKAAFYAVKNTKAGDYHPDELAMVSRTARSGDTVIWPVGSMGEVDGASRDDHGDPKTVDASNPTQTDAMHATSDNLAGQHGGEDDLQTADEKASEKWSDSHRLLGDRRKGAVSDDEKHRSKSKWVSGGSNTAGWLQHYRQGNYQSAMEAAREAGLDALLSTLTVNELWMLIHAARTVGEDAVATDALITFRNRFPDNAKAKRAAFLLGKIHFDQSRDLVVAARWFSVYLSESPDGPLADEALGRLMMIHDRQGLSQDAKRAAQHYLVKYPSGSYADNAREVLEEE